MTKDEALTLALEALENHCGNYKLDDDGVKRYIAACDAIEEALAQPEQEPAPGYCKHCKQYTIQEPLLVQPERPWVGLTDEELRELEKQFNAERVRTSDEEYLVIYPGDYWAWQRAIEAKLKEKNT